MLVSVGYRCIDHVIIHLTTFHSKLEQGSRKRVESSCGEDYFTLRSLISMHSICTDLCNFNYARRGYFSMSCCLLNLSIFAFSSSCTVSLAPSQHDALYLLRQHHLPPISAIFLCPNPSLALLVSRFGSYVYLILRFLHPLAATLAVDINKHLDYTVKAASTTSPD